MIQSLRIASIVGVSTGGAALCLLMLGHVVRARWVAAVRRPLELVVLTLVVFVVADLVALPTRQLAGTGPLLLFTLAVALVLVFLSRAQDTTRSTQPTLWLRRVSAAGLPLVVTALVVWGMNTFSTFHSSVVGFQLLAGGAGAALGLVALTTAWWSRRGRLPFPFRGPHGYTVGRVMLTAVCLWGYLSFCQFLLIWSAQMPETLGWLQHRIEGPWAGVLSVLAATHLVIPMGALLARRPKEIPSVLAGVGLLLVLAHTLDIVWLLGPSLNATPLAGFAATLVTWTAGVSFAWIRMRKWPAVPSHDPVGVVQRASSSHAPS